MCQVEFKSWIFFPFLNFFVHCCHSNTGLWDDHDFGINNYGNNYQCKQESQNEFAYHFNLPNTDPRHPEYPGPDGQQEGIYTSFMFNNGASDPGIHLINLDNRYHRDPTFSDYGTCKGASSTMLGRDQSLPAGHRSYHRRPPGIQMNIAHMMEQAIHLILPTRTLVKGLALGQRVQHTRAGQSFLKKGLASCALFNKALTMVMASYLSLSAAINIGLK